MPCIRTKKKGSDILLRRTHRRIYTVIKKTLRNEEPVITCLISFLSKYGRLIRFQKNPSALAP